MLRQPQNGRLTGTACELAASRRHPLLQNPGGSDMPTAISKLSRASVLVARAIFAAASSSRCLLNLTSASAGRLR